MNKAEFETLNGEQLLHKVWVVRKGQPVGIRDQTIGDICDILHKELVVKIEPQGGTLEGKVRECQKWGCE